MSHETRPQFARGAGDEETTFLGGVNYEPADMSKPMINVKLNGASIQLRVDAGADAIVIFSKIMPILMKSK